MSEEWKWYPRPAGFYERFEAKLESSGWTPPHIAADNKETWEQFKNRIELQVARQLTAYKARVEDHWGPAPSEKLYEVAEWTVRYQKGESVAAIVQTINIGTLSDPEQSTFKAIQRFASSIGLNLRRRGIRKKRTIH